MMLRNASIAYTSQAIRSCIPWKPNPKHASALAFASSSKRINLLGRTRFDEDMFSDDSTAETDNSSADLMMQEKEDDDDDEEEDGDDDEEAVRLVPQQWRMLQDDLYKTRSERKLDAKVQARMNELKRADMLLLKRKQLEAAGKALKERLYQRSQEENTASAFDKSLSITTRSHVEAPNQLNQNEESSPKPVFGLNSMFSEEEISLLKRGTPDMNKLDCKKWLPLQVLVAAGQFFFVEEYLKSAIDIDAFDEDGYTPIHRAILGRRETSVSQLVRAGADPYKLDKDGASFLHYSAHTGSLNLVSLFLKCGVDIDLADQDGWTALHVAVLTCREDIVRHLLLSGANQNQKTKDGYTPFDLCLALGHGSKNFAIAKNLKRLPKTQSSNEETDIEGLGKEEKQLDAI